MALARRSIPLWSKSVVSCSYRRLSSAADGPLAFYGLGNMGHGMALNLVKAGYEVRAYDPSAAAREAAEKVGLQVSPTIEAAADGAAYIVSMLPTGAHAASLYLGDGDSGGLLQSVGASTTMMDCSTIDAHTARTIGDAAAARNLHFMDTPVSGGVAAAAAGSAQTAGIARVVLRGLPA